MIYRKLTQDEVLELASRIRFQDRVDLPAIRAGIAELFPGAHKALLSWSSEYNDEGYDLRPNEIQVWDKAGQLLVRPDAKTDYNDSLYQFFNEVEIADCGQNDSMGDMTVFIKETKGLDLPDLFVKES